MMQARWLALCVVCGIAMVHAAPLDYVLPLVGLRQRGSVAFEMDIHLPVSGEALEAVQSANAFLNAHLNSTEIDFSSKHKPHVTLYLTTWSCGSFTSRGGGSPEKVLTCLEKIETAICEIAPQLEALGPCTVGLSNVYAAGEFAMMNVSYSPCLQRFSDVVVNATNQYSLPNQTAPDWVYSLPEPERSEKLRYIALYGSPNVFSQFSPHVSLAWGPDAHSISAAIDALPLTPARLNFVGDVFSLGTVGQHGTVLSHMDLASYNVSLKGDEACRLRHVLPSACRADSTSSGGCVWCRVFGRAPFCTTKFEARQLPRPPHGPPFYCLW